MKSTTPVHTTHPLRRALKPLAGSIAALLLLGATHHASAGSATWLAAPATGNWNTAGNWTAGGPPNGAADTATFATSATTLPFISVNTAVDGITFNPGGSAFTITVNPNIRLTLSGTGLTNNSGITQNFVAAVAGAGNSGDIRFTNNATAGINTAFTNNGGAFSGGSGGFTVFLNSSTVVNATFTTNGGTFNNAQGGGTQFFDTSTVIDGTFISNGGTVAGAQGGNTDFSNSSTVLNGTFTANGGTGGAGGSTRFFGTSTVVNGTFTTNGALVSGGGSASTNFANTSNAGHGIFTTNGSGFAAQVGGLTGFTESADAAYGTFTTNGGTVPGSFGGNTRFLNTSKASAATLIANGGTGGGGGGGIQFFGDSTGGTAVVKVFGNGSLDISGHNAPGVTIGSLEGTGLVFLGARNLTVGSNNGSTTFSGVIQDTGTGGSLTKIGTGTLRLTGNNDYSGGTFIDSGYLAVGSDHALGRGDVVLRVGIFGTYNGPRDIHVERNYVQFGAETNGTYNGGTLRLGLGGTGPGQSDRLVVAGTATLAGTLDLVPLNGYRIKRGDKIQLVSAVGGVLGKFVEVNNPFEKTGTLLSGGVFYKTNAVYFEAIQGSFAGLDGLTPNQKAVGRNLDRVVWHHQANKLIDFLDAESLGNLRHDFDKIAPEELASVFNIGVSLANVQSSNLERRMGDIQAGSAGFSTSGYALNAGGPSYSSDAGYNNGARGPEGKGGKELRAPEDNRWGVFVTGVGEFTNIGNTSNASGYDLTTGGLTIGVDYKVTPNFALGINTGYARTGADLTGNGRVTVDGAKLGLYATYFTGTGFYADAALNGGYNSYDTRRSALQGTARGSAHGGEFNALMATGYDWKRGGLSIGPAASLQYTYVGLDSFIEHGSLAPLKIANHGGESLRTALGMKASYDWQVGGVVVRPEVRAAWQHEFGDSSFALDSRFANGAGNTFTVRGPVIGADSLLIGAGVAVLWNERTSTYVYYDGEVARSNYSSNNVSGGVRLSF